MKTPHIKSRNELHLLLDDKNLIGVEIGVECGSYSEYLLNTGIFKKLYSIDDWDNKFYDTVDENNEPLRIHSRNLAYLDTIKKLNKFDSSKIIREKSEIVVNLFDDNYFDFIYIDSNHTYDNVKKDLEIWWPKLKNGGLFCGDDYFNGETIVKWKNKKYKCLFDVKKAVDEFSIRVNKDVKLIPRSEYKDEFPNWIIKK